MKRIANLLSRLANITPPDGVVREKAREVIKEKVNISIEKQHITVRNNVLFLSVSPIQKNEVFLKKGEILGELNKDLKSTEIRDIR